MSRDLHHHYHPSPSSFSSSLSSAPPPLSDNDNSGIWPSHAGSIVDSTKGLLYCKNNLTSIRRILMRPNVTPQVLAWEPLAASRFPELYEGEHVQEPQPPPYLLARLTILKPISKNYGFYMFLMFLIRKPRFLVFFKCFFSHRKKPVFFSPKKHRSLERFPGGAPWRRNSQRATAPGTLRRSLLPGWPLTRGASAPWFDDGWMGWFFNVVLLEIDTYQTKSETFSRGSNNDQVVWTCMNYVEIT